MRRARAIAGLSALALAPGIARASGGLDVDHPEVQHAMRVSLGPLTGAYPRDVDAFTFSYGSRTYRGAYDVARLPDGTNVVVNTLPLDAYLYGVVSHEVSAAWPRAALRAQAIAARTYAFLRRRPTMPFDVVASTSDQYYGGVATEEVPVRDAVDSTSGQFVLWDGRPAHVLYSSCCGGFTADVGAVRMPPAPLEIALRDLGRSDEDANAGTAPDDSREQSAAAISSASAAPATSDSAPPSPSGAAPIEPTAGDIDREMAHSGSRTYVPPPNAPGAPPARPLSGGGEFPYLTAHADPNCTGAPGYDWTQTLSFDPARYFGADVGRNLGTLRSVELRDVDASGRPAVVRLIGSRAAYDIDSGDFRRRVGASVVRSTRLRRAACDGQNLSLTGSGFGHGVGLCQWGAHGMAVAGSSFADIIAFYFPGTALGSV